jgi:hypothetical protein
MLLKVVSYLRAIKIGIYVLGMHFFNPFQKQNFTGGGEREEGLKSEKKFHKLFV